MTARPILFAAPMVRALLEDRKTQTRRVVKPQPYVNGYKFTGQDILCHEDNLPPSAMLLDIGRGANRYTTSDLEGWETSCPFGVPGDLLWVRETWCGKANPESGIVEWNEDGHTYPIHYQADGDDVVAVDDDGFKRFLDNGRAASPWKPSIHMPRWASRLTLKITEVRVLRLQEISAEDCIAEGLLRVTGDGLGPRAGHKWIGDGFHGGRHSKAGAPLFHTSTPDGRCRCQANGSSPAQCAFSDLWDSLHRADEAWAANPWVWALTFEVLHANVDAVLENRETQA